MKVKKSQAGPRHGVASESHCQGLPYNDDERLKAFVDMRQAEPHRALQCDMIEELWSCRH